MLLDYTKMNNRGCFNSSIIPLGFCLTSLTSHNKSQKCHSTISLKTISIVTHIHHSTRYESHLNPWLNLNMSTCPWFLDIMVDDVSFVNFVTEPISAAGLFRLRTHFTENITYYFGAYLRARFYSNTNIALILIAFRFEIHLFKLDILEKIISNTLSW